MLRCLAGEEVCAEVVRWQYGGMDGGNALKDKICFRWLNMCLGEEVC